jgi:hypothetical protein
MGINNNVPEGQVSLVPHHRSRGVRSSSPQHHPERAPLSGYGGHVGRVLITSRPCWRGRQRACGSSRSTLDTSHLDDGRTGFSGVPATPTSGFCRRRGASRQTDVSVYGARTSVIELAVAFSSCPSLKGGEAGGADLHVGALCVGRRARGGLICAHSWRGEA